MGFINFFKKLSCKHEIEEWLKTERSRTRITDPWSSETGWITYTKFISNCKKCGKKFHQWRITKSAGYGGLDFSEYPEGKIE